MSDILLIRGNALQLPLLGSSVQLVVTSPPYWGGMREYDGMQELIWGGDVKCEHEWKDAGSKCNRWGLDKNVPEKQATVRGNVWEIQLGYLCVKCDAWRGAYGWEPKIEMYVRHTIEILREIRRVLRPDGVVFWNIDDTRANDAKWGGSTGGKHAKDLHEVGVGRGRRYSGLKAKDLCLIPQRVAIAAQDDGWWVRSVIKWVKDNPMPEPVSDRPADAYEDILMLTANAKYFWDTEAVRERGSTLYPPKDSIQLGVKQKILGQNLAGSLGMSAGKNGRHLRNVWTFPTQHYGGAHTATFPEELPTRCILAASRPGDYVLDPFGGSGTTGKVALRLRRRCVLVDLAYTQDGYGTMATQRTAQDSLPF